MSSVDPWYVASGARPYGPAPSARSPVPAPLPPPKPYEAPPLRTFFFVRRPPIGPAFPARTPPPPLKDFDAIFIASPNLMPFAFATLLMCEIHAERLPPTGAGDEFVCSPAASAMCLFI